MAAKMLAETTNAGAISEQVVAPQDGTGNGDGLNTVSAVGGTGTAGTFTDNDGFLQVRWELSSPFTVSAGKIPSMSIAFDISAALVFNDGSVMEHVMAMIFIQAHRQFLILLAIKF